MKKQENGLGQRESSNVQTTKRKRFGNNNNKTETILWNSRRLSWIFQKSFSFAARRRLLKNSKWSLHSFFLTTRTFFFVHKVQEIEICRLRNLSPTCGHARKVLLGLRIKKNFFSADVRNAPRGLHWLPSPRFLFRMFYPRHQQNIYSPLLYNYTLSDSLQFDTGGVVL